MLSPMHTAFEHCARPEFTGAADALVASHSEWPDRMRIEPYPVDVLAQERRRGTERKRGLSSELRMLDRYLEEVRRAAGA